MNAELGQHKELLLKKAADNNNNNNNNNNNKDEDDEEQHVYGRRWYIVAIAALLTAAQGGYWANFGPIAPAIKPLLGVGDGTIALWNNYGPIGYFIAILPSTLVLDTMGLRPATLGCLWLVFLGSLVKCFYGDGTAAVVCIHIGQFLNGLAGPISMCIGPVVSATWFPPRQRATATSIISVCNYGGCAAMFVLGPMMVKTPASSVPTPEERHRIAYGLLAYMRYETIFCGLLLLMATVYFPNTPPKAPSRSAKEERVDFWQGIREIIFNGGHFWYCAMSYGMLTGFYGGWGSMLGSNLQHVLPKDTAQDDAGWIGFGGAIGGMVGGIAFSVAADSMGGRMRTMLMALCVLSAAAFLIFALICDKTIQLSVSLLYCMSILGGLLVNGTIPLFYELGVESAYPIAEGLTTSVLTLINNFWCLVFLFVPSIPGLGSSTSWMNWSVVAGAMLGFVLMIPFREDYKRLNFDLEIERGEQR